MLMQTVRKAYHQVSRELIYPLTGLRDRDLRVPSSTLRLQAVTVSFSEKQLREWRKFVEYLAEVREELFPQMCNGVSLVDRFVLPHETLMVYTILFVT